MDSVTSRVKTFILDRFIPGEDPANLTSDTPLISGGILDSLATLELVSYLEDQFGIQLEAHEVDAERLDTLERINSLVASKQGVPR